MNNFDIWATCFVAAVMVLAGAATFVLVLLKTLGAIVLSWVMVFAPIWALLIIALAAEAVALLVMWLLP